MDGLVSEAGLVQPSPEGTSAQLLFLQRAGFETAWFNSNNPEFKSNQKCQILISNSNQIRLRAATRESSPANTPAQT